MIKGLYKFAEKWSEKGSVWLFSDPHFGDPDCKYMDEDWISPEEQAEILRKTAHKNDTLIILGDIGDPSYLSGIKAYKVLVAGNHDKGLSKYKDYFDEMYGGPLFISDKILLSHEPILFPYAFNIHGHDHNKGNVGSYNHINVAANVIGYTPISLGDLIKSGGISAVENIHEKTVREASQDLGGYSPGFFFHVKTTGI